MILPGNMCNYFIQHPTARSTVGCLESPHPIVLIESASPACPASMLCVLSYQLFSWHFFVTMVWGGYSELASCHHWLASCHHLGENDYEFDMCTYLKYLPLCHLPVSWCQCVWAFPKPCLFRGLPCVATRHRAHELSLASSFASAPCRPKETQVHWGSREFQDRQTMVTLW